MKPQTVTATDGRHVVRPGACPHPRRPSPAFIDEVIVDTPTELPQTELRPQTTLPQTGLPQTKLPQIGLQHPRIRQLRHVINNTAPNHKRLFVAEGLWAHNVLLDLDTPVEMFLWCPEAAYSDEARTRSTQIAQRARSAYRISPKVLDLISERERPDGMVSLVALPSWDGDTLTLADDALVLVADAIEIPGNLGTLLRTLDACGAACLVLTNRRTRLSHPKVFRGSRGMNLRVPVLEFDEPAQAAQWLRARGFAVYLATVGEDAEAYHDVRFSGRVAVVVGNERYGISRPWFGYGFRQITVPMQGRADSLNVSVSASILLYDVRTRAS